MWKYSTGRNSLITAIRSMQVSPPYRMEQALQAGELQHKPAKHQGSPFSNRTELNRETIQITTKKYLNELIKCKLKQKH